jgi:NAD(P)-binding Rossmann-like domain
MNHGKAARQSCSRALYSTSHAVSRSCVRELQCLRQIRLRNSTRTFSTTSAVLASSVSPPNKGKELDIAILGGGFSGLCTAFYLLAWHQRAFPGRTPKITIYEGSHRVGGWVRTRKIGEPGKHWLFECGPRTLRLLPESMLLQLVGLDHLKVQH